MKQKQLIKRLEKVEDKVGLRLLKLHETLNELENDFFTQIEDIIEEFCEKEEK